MFDAVIFDLDGTLLDTLADIAHAVNEVLVEHGLSPLPIENYRTLVGDGVAVLMERVILETKSDIVLRASCVSSFARHYEKHWNKTSKPYDGISEMLNSLSDARMPMAVLSNKPDSFTRRCIDYYFPNISFASVLGHSERFPKKPDPASSLWLSQSLGVSADRIAYVGDTNTDMKTAVAAGFFAIGISWGFRTRTELIQSGACVVYDHPSDLLVGLLGR